MTKTKAHAILDRIRDGQNTVSILETVAALERTGDLCRAFSESLRFDGNEQRNNRPCQAQSQATAIGFSYSKYLDCETIESIK